MPGRAFDYLRRLNAPRDIEDSRQLRAAVWASVSISIYAVALQGAAGMGLALSSVALITAGYYVSWRRRYRNNLAIKSVIMVLTLAALASFLRQVALQPYDPRIPLAELFVWVQVLHGFDLPRAKDLLLALVSSLVLLALASSFALTASFGLIILLWLAAALPALYYLQLSRLRGLSAEPERSSLPMPRLRRLAALLAVIPVMVLAGGLAVGAFMPRINASYLHELPFSIRRAWISSDGYSFTNPGYPDLPLRPPHNALEINPEAYFGFGPYLDLRSRGTLVDLPVMKVRSTEPAYWGGLYFSEYNGFAWLTPADEPQRLSAPAQPFELKHDSGVAHRATRTVVQTYYLEAEQPSVIFASFRPEAVYFPADYIFHDESGLKSPFALTDGLVYSVVSRHIDDTRLPASIAEATGDALLPFLELPEMPQRVLELAARITPDGAGPYARALAIEEFLASEYAYSLDVPELPAGRDAVDHFLFEHRRGYCEHFASAYAVLCRLAGVPSRVVTGYSTGDYNPFTGLYEVGLADAHAWVEIYLEGIGWVAREPTPGFSMPEAGSGSRALWVFRDFFSWMGSTLSALLPAPLRSALAAAAAAAASAASAAAAGFLFSVREAPWLPALLLLFVLSFPLARLALRRRRAVAPPVSLDAPLLAMREFLEGLDSLGFARSPGQTAGELAAEVSSLVPGLDLSGELMLFERARYGGPPLAEDEVRRLRQGLKAALERIVARADRRPGFRKRPRR